VSNTSKVFAIIDLFFISQGSVVTHIRYGEKYDIILVANLPLIPTVKEFLKSVNSSQSFERIQSGNWHVFYRPRYSNIAPFDEIEKEDR